MTKPNLSSACPIDVERLIETRMLVQANSGGGKSWAIRRLAEQTYGKAQQIIIDHDGEYHTLREKFDYVLAGQKGDCPADIQSAALLARKILELNVSVIIDIYELGLQRPLFVKRFLDALVNAPRDLWHPAIVILDEAHVYCPEQGSAVSADAVKGLMALGRKRGFCGILATQRISKLHKDAAAEANNKLIGRAAIDVDMKRAANELGFTGREDMLSLRDLAAGEFYAFGPALLDRVTKIKVGSVSTTHLRAGQRAAPPTPPTVRMKKILAELVDLPHEAVEEAKSIDELRARVKQLEGELRKAPAAKVEIKTVEVAVFKADMFKRTEALIEKMSDLGIKLIAGSNEMTSALRNQSDRPLPKALPLPTKKTDVGRGWTRAARETPAYKRDRNEIPTSEATNVLPKGEMRILRALLSYPNGLELKSITVLTGYKQTSRYEFLRSLRAKGFVDDVINRPSATSEARKRFPDIEPLPTGEALRDLWLQGGDPHHKLSKGEKLILTELIGVYPDSLMGQDIEERTSYKQTSVYEYSRQLSAKELVVVDRGTYKASPTLFEVL